MTRSILLCSLFLPTLLTYSAAAQEKEGGPARQALNDHLATLNGADRGQVVELEADCLAKTFADRHFFVLQFRKFPVAIAPPPPLAGNTLFAVAGDKVTRMGDEKELVKYFQQNIPETKTGKVATEVGKSWLLLAKEFHQDGFFQFQEPAIKLSRGVVEGTLAVVEQKGDKGELTVRLEFAAGKLLAAKPGGKLMPGIRPRCQATRLLHPDLAIRDIMRRDLLVMGRSCKEYLDEQRAKAGPELKKAIDDVWRQIVAEGR